MHLPNVNFDKNELSVETNDELITALADLRNGVTVNIKGQDHQFNNVFDANGKHTKKSILDMESNPDRGQPILTKLQSFSSNKKDLIPHHASHILSSRHIKSGFTAIDRKKMSIEGTRKECPQDPSKTLSKLIFLGSAIIKRPSLFSSKNSKLNTIYI